MKRPTAPALREIALVASCCLFYSVLCAIAPVSRTTALRHGHAILALEEALGLAVEAPLNSWLHGEHALTLMATTFYTTAFFLVTVVALMLAWRHDRAHYLFHRRVLFVMTFAAMATYWLFPVAPPRLLDPTLFVDSVHRLSPWGDAWGDFTSAFQNQYGAMPSMHTGWAIWVATTLWTPFVTHWQRTLLFLYPTVTVLVILATANHYVLDAVAGGAYYLVARLAVARISAAPVAADAAARMPSEVRHEAVTEATPRR